MPTPQSPDNCSFLGCTVMLMPTRYMATNDHATYNFLYFAVLFRKAIKPSEILCEQIPPLVRHVRRASHARLSCGPTGRGRGGEREGRMVWPVFHLNANTVMSVGLKEQCSGHWTGVGHQNRQCDWTTGHILVPPTRSFSFIILTSYIVN